MADPKSGREALTGIRNLTALGDPLLAPTVQLDFVRPYFGWGDIQRRETTANGCYNGMQVRLRRRMSKQVTLGVAYTWSKSIDNATSGRDATDVPPDSTNARAGRGPAHRHRPVLERQAP